MNNIQYPIHRLNRNITQILGRIINADILGNIKKGLRNEISFFDEGEHISDVAEILPNCSRIKTDEAYVKLSSAYCQYLWLIDDYVLKTIDFKIIQDSCQQNGIAIADFKKSITRVIHNSRIIPEFPGFDKMHYIAYLKSVLPIIDSQDFKNEFDLAMTFNDLSKPIDFPFLCEISMDGPYEQRTNTVYCYGIAFILLHELSHFSLKHLDKEAVIKDEKDADINAFWNVYNDISDNEKFSANIGILCALFSLMMLNPYLEENGVHPREDKRMFYVYDNIKEYDEKYTVLLIELFHLWAEKNNISRFPTQSGNREKDIEAIRSFLDSYSK